METLVYERESLYLFSSDEHGIAVFTDDICQKDSSAHESKFYWRNIRKKHEKKLKTTYFYKKQYSSL